MQSVGELEKLRAVIWALESLASSKGIAPENRQQIEDFKKRLEAELKSQLGDALTLDSIPLSDDMAAD